MHRLEDREWMEFPISAIASISSGKRLTKADMLLGKMPFIGASDSCNGVTEFISNKNESEDRNVLGVNYNGSVVENFYHPYRAIFSDDVKRLHLLDREGNQYIYLFLKVVILKQKRKYQYSYKFNEARLKRQKILLPVTDSGDPDFDYMENYGKKLTAKKIADCEDYARKIISDIEYKELPMFHDVEWKAFFLKEVFSRVQRGKRLKKENQNNGNIPYISSTAFCNGVDNFIGNEAGVRKFSNCLTIANSGSVGSAFFHPYDFVASDHVTHLWGEKYNKFSYLFVSMLLRRLSSKYNFNREINDKRISREKILLPVTDSGDPDFEYMEQCAKNIYRKKIEEYLEYLAVIKADLQDYFNN